MFSTTNYLTDLTSIVFEMMEVAGPNQEMLRLLKEYLEVSVRRKAIVSLSGRGVFEQQFAAFHRQVAAITSSDVLDVKELLSLKAGFLKKAGVDLVAMNILSQEESDRSLDVSAALEQAIGLVPSVADMRDSLVAILRQFTLEALAFEKHKGSESNPGKHLRIRGLAELEAQALADTLNTKNGCRSKVGSRGDDIFVMVWLEPIFLEDTLIIRAIEGEYQQKLIDLTREAAKVEEGLHVRKQKIANMQGFFGGLVGKALYSFCRKEEGVDVIVFKFFSNDAFYYQAMVETLRYFRINFFKLEFAEGSCMQLSIPLDSVLPSNDIEARAIYQAKFIKIFFQAIADQCGVQLLVVETPLSFAMTADDDATAHIANLMIARVFDIQSTSSRVDGSHVIKISNFSYDRIKGFAPRDVLINYNTLVASVSSASEAARVRTGFFANTPSAAAPAVRSKELHYEDAAVAAVVEAMSVKNGQPYEIPPLFTCSITHGVMADPVSTFDGQVYERAAITQWLKDNNTSPATGAVLANKNLIDAVSIRSAIRDIFGSPTEKAVVSSRPGF